MDDELIQKHFLVPGHVKLTEEEKRKFLDEKAISVKQMPMIRKSDPAIVNLNPEAGDIIKIKRKSDTTGESEYYRVVIIG